MGLKVVFRSMQRKLVFVFDKNGSFEVIFFNLMSFFWMFSGGTMFIIFKVT